MTEHQKVIEQALTRLYQRIQLPSAADKIHYNAALKAVRSLPEARRQPPVTARPQESTEKITDLTVPQVQAAVESGKLSAEVALLAEKASEFPRKTLLNWLEAQIEVIERDAQ